MRIEYIQPLTLAWNRMVQDLFKPFRAGRWFAVGFAAWLVSLGGGGGGNFNVPTGRGRDLSADQARVLESVKEFFSGPFGISLLVGLVVFVVTLIVLFLWLSSRAQFVFLDQVTGRHWRIADPWGRYATQGNSLFLWKIGFTIVLVAAILVLAGPAIAFLVIREQQSIGVTAVLAIAWMVLVILALVVPAAFIQCFLHGFVVPLMYRDGSTTTDAWRRFLPLLREHTARFILYGLFVFVLSIGIAVLVFTISCATCCIGFCLLILPYLGTVFSLPIPYTFRGLGPSFLAQFGSDYWAWPEIGEVAGAMSGAPEMPGMPGTPPPLET